MTMNGSPFDQSLPDPPPSATSTQPPQIFTNYGSDASLLPTYFDHDASFNWDDADGGDAKRRRIARACDVCRRKKIKCDGKLPACTNCQNYKTECIFTHIEKKRNPPKGYESAPDGCLHPQKLILQQGKVHRRPRESPGTNGAPSTPVRLAHGG